MIKAIKGVKDLLPEESPRWRFIEDTARRWACLLYTSDAADARSSGDLGGRRIIKKKNTDDTVDVNIRQTKSKHTEEVTHK